MKKVLKKSLETEIDSVLKAFLYNKDPKALRKIEKIIKKASRSLSKEFIKAVEKINKQKSNSSSDKESKLKFTIEKSEILYGVPSKKTPKSKITQSKESEKIKSTSKTKKANFSKNKK
jgi:hypothetical protein